MRKKPPQSKCYFSSSGVNVALERLARCDDDTLLRDEFAFLVMTKLGISPPCRPQSKKAKTGKQTKMGSSGKK